MSDNTLHHLYGPSSLQRRELCPGSARLEKDLPSVETEDSKAGTDFHAEVAAMIEESRKSGYDAVISGHSEEAVKAFDKFRSAVECETADDETFEFFAEKPLKFEYYGELQYSGTADVLIVCKDHVVVMDWKFGHRFIDSAENNDQGAAYALAAMQEFKKEKAVVIFYNPVIGQYSTANFTDRIQLITVLMGIINKSKEENAPLIPGEDQCRYCKAAAHGVCPALAKETTAVAMKAEALIPLPSLAELSPDDLCELKRKCDLVSKLCERVDNRIKTLCEENGTCGCWTLKEVSGGREIKDIQGAFGASGMDSTMFLDCCTASVSKLEKAFAKSGKDAGTFKTEKEGKEAFGLKMSEFILAKPSKKTLVAVRA